MYSISLTSVLLIFMSKAFKRFLLKSLSKTRVSSELQMEEEKLVQLNVRIPKTLKQLMREYVELNAHKDLSELTRDALREKIQRDAPNLYGRLFSRRQKP